MFRQRKIKTILFLGIILLGFLLRYHNLNTWPRKGATFDEYAWTWLGMNIIQKGVRISWSPQPEYKNAKNIIYQQTHFRIVRPFLEHPPLFGIVAGGFAIANGVKGMYSLDIAKIRPLALVLGTISIVLVFFLTRELYGTKLGLIAGLLYATIPTIVVGSRIVQNENFFIPIWLFSLFLVARYIKTKNKYLKNVAILICSLLILAKIPWIAASISLFAIFLYYKKYKDCLLIVFGAIVALAIFGIYGYIYDWNLFISLWKLQAGRYDIVFESIFALFQKPYLVDRFYTDGWIFFGWIAFMLLLIKDFKKNIFVVVPLFAYFLIFLSGVPDEPGHGWYRYPFYPFLVIATALFLKDYFAKNFALTFSFLVFVGTSLLGLTWQTVFGFSFVVFRVAIISWTAVLLPYFPMFQKKTKFAIVISYCWLAVFIAMNIWASIIYNEQ